MNHSHVAYSNDDRIRDEWGIRSLAYAQRRIFGSAASAYAGRMSESYVRSSDIVRLLEIVESAEAVDDTEFFYSGVLRGLAELVPCEELTFQLMDIPRRSCQCLALVEGEIEAYDDEANQDPDPEGTARFWAAYWMPGGCSGGESPDYTRVERSSDLFGDREYRSYPMGRLMAGWGVRHEMLAAMQPHGILDRRLLLFRERGPDFTDREVGIIKLIRPHLAELHVRRQHELDGAPALTPRQWEVLRRVSLGASNAQIGRMLGLSEATVRKHLENIFLRLHAASRTEAVRKVSGFI